MNKRQKRWKKQEKQIVKLLYKKGLIDVHLDQMYWADYSVTGKYSKRYFEEVYYNEIDYYGEVTEHKLIDSIIEGLFYDGCIIEDLEKMVDDGTWPKSSFKYKGRSWFIRYLRKLPTVVHDNKINKVLRLDFNL